MMYNITARRMKWIYQLLRSNSNKIVVMSTLLTLVILMQQSNVSDIEKILNNNLKYETLADMKNFQFLLGNPRVCHEKGKIDIIFVVPSHPENSQRRTELRSIYNRQIQGISMRAVFLMGHIAHSNTSKMIQKEFSDFKDIVQGNFIDSYRNVTYNHLQGLKWASIYCPKASYVIKVDDDIYVNLHKLLSRIYRLENEFENKIFCAVFHKAPVMRNVSSKYYVSYEEYPHELYPTYCNGWLVVYPQNVAKKLVSMASKTPFMWMSDVHITGTLVEKSNITFIDMSKSYTYRIDRIDSWFNKASDLPPYYVGPGKEKLAMYHKKSDEFYSFKIL